MQGSINFDGSLIGNISGGGGGGGSEVVITPVLTSGTKIADVTVDGEDKDLFAPTPTPPTPATEVSVTQTLASGTKIGSIEVDGESTDLFAPTPTPPTPATEVSVTQTLASGTKIGSIEVDGESTDLYAPTPTPPTPATEVSVTQVLSEGTKIASIEVDGDSTDIYAPTPSTIAASATLASGTKIGSITINNVTTDLYAPNPTAVSANPIGSTGDNIGSITINGTTYSFYAPYQSAANTSYDNTISELTADDVQEAIDKISGITGDGQLDIGDDLTDGVNQLKQSLSDFAKWEYVQLGTPSAGTIVSGTYLIKNSALRLAILSIQWNGITANATVALNVDIQGSIDKPIYGWNSYNNRQVNGLLRASDNKLEVLEAQPLARLYTVFPIESQ